MDITPSHAHCICVKCFCNNRSVNVEKKNIFRYMQAMCTETVFERAIKQQQQSRKEKSATVRNKHSTESLDMASDGGASKDLMFRRMQS